MKLLIIWLIRNGNCRYWINSKRIEQAAMSLVCLRGAIERMAAEDGISFDEAWKKYFKTINGERQITTQQRIPVPDSQDRDCVKIAGMALVYAQPVRPAADVPMER